MEEVIVPLPIAFRIDRAIRMRRLRDSVAEDQVEMKPDDKEDYSRQDEDMEGKKTGQGVAGNRASAQQKVADGAADKRRPPRLFGTDYQRPESVLIPAQGLAGKTHAQDGKQQHSSAEPVHFPGELVGTGQKDPNDVGYEQDDHGRGPEIVHSPQQVAERCLFAQSTEGSDMPARRMAHTSLPVRCR